MKCSLRIYGLLSYCCNLNLNVVLEKALGLNPCTCCISMYTHKPTESPQFSYWMCSEEILDRQDTESFRKRAAYPYISGPGLCAGSVHPQTNKAEAQIVTLQWFGWNVHLGCRDECRNAAYLHCLFTGWSWRGWRILHTSYLCGLHTVTMILILTKT